MSCNALYVNCLEEPKKGDSLYEIYNEVVYAIEHNGDASITCDMMEKVPDMEFS